jgi:uncharacterized protein (TIGR02246 family)
MSRSDIDALNATFVQAWEKGDAGTLASVYAPDGRVLPPGAPPVTGAAIEQFWKGVLDSGITAVSLETLSFEEQGDLAVEEGHYTLRAGDQVADDGSYVVVHRRQPDGAWRFGIDIFNSDRAAPGTGDHV